jgi:hypothetical protein
MDLNTFALRNPDGCWISNLSTFSQKNEKTKHSLKKHCNHFHVPTYVHKLHTIKVTNYPHTWTLLHVSEINCHPQTDINTKPYILLKHQIDAHNVEMYSNRYKYNNVANMDSMMLSGFGLKLISMPLFTLCSDTHTNI